MPTGVSPIDVSSFCLSLHDCGSMEELANVALQGLNHLYGASEIRWMEIERANKTLLWSSTHSEAEKKLSQAGFTDEIHRVSEIGAFYQAIKRQINSADDSLFLLSESISLSALKRTSYYQEYMNPLGVNEMVGLQVYHTDGGAILLSIGFDEAGLGSIEKRGLVLIRDHLRRACKKLSSLASRSNLIMALKEARKEDFLTGITVLSSDGTKLWDVDSISEALLTRTSIGKKQNGLWVLHVQLQQWIEECIQQYARILAGEQAHTRVFGKRGNTLVASIYLERVGRGGVLLLASQSAKKQGYIQQVNVDSFTRREREIASLMLNDESSIEMAEALQISKRTVEKHLENIYLKLSVKNRLAAIKRLKPSRG